MKRRALIKGLGSVTILVIGSGVWRAFDQGVFNSGEGPAYEAWKNWREESTGSLNLVRAAILAANPHNTQPWLFKVTNSKIELFADIDRNLGTMDVFLREMAIGLGCAVENMLLTAEAEGYRYKLELKKRTLKKPFPSQKPELVATLYLLGKMNRNVSKLYKAIPSRHTDRAPYKKERAIPIDKLATLLSLNNDKAELKSFFFTSEPKRMLFSAGCVKATKAIINDKKMSQDSSSWFRHDWDEVQKHKDGPFIDTAGVSPFLRAVVKILPPVSEKMANDGWLESTKLGCESSPVLGFIAVRNLYDGIQSMRAGQLWQRMHLWATTQGISMQPINQMCEIVDRELELEKEPKMAALMDNMTEDPAWKPTFAFRIGYPTIEQLKSPRRPVKEVLI